MNRPPGFSAPRVAKLAGMAFVLAVCTSITFWSPNALAADGTSKAGHGYISVGYQFISVDGFESSIGELPIGTVDTHSLNIEVEYFLNDKWTLVAGIPYVVKRYQGPGQHDPLQLDPPRPEVENVDQGDWNNSFQDFHLGLRYLARESPLFIEPFIYFGVPSHDYPFFGHAAVGQDLLKLDVGSTFAYSPPLSDAYFRVDASYVFVEETLGVDVSHWRINAETGYFFGPRITGRVFLMYKHGDGLVFPDDFPTPRTGEQWFQHDRMVKHNYTNAGAGLDWVLDQKYQLSTAVLTMIDADQVHKMDFTLSIGITRSF